MSNLNSQKIFLISVLIFLFLTVACEEKPPLTQDKFIKVYVDLLIIQDTTSVEIFSLDSVKGIVFQRHSISSGQYDSTIKYYNSEPDRWIEFFDSAGAYVERLKSNAGNQF